MYNEAHAKSQKLNENINETNMNCHNLQNNIKTLRNKIQEKK